MEFQWILILVLISLAVIYLMYMIRQRIIGFYIFDKIGIIGPKPNFIYGNLHPLRSCQGRNYIQTMTNWTKRYGNIYGFFSGVRPVIVIKDLDLVKDILIRKSQQFINRPSITVRAKPLEQTLAGLRDQRWKDVRSILTPTFSTSKMKHMSHLMCSSINVSLEILDEFNGQDFDALTLYQGLTCQVISECALAMKVNCQRDPNDKFLKAISGFLKNALSPIVFVALCFPFIGCIITKVVERLAISGQMTKMICKNVERVIKIRREEKAKEILISSSDHGHHDEVNHVVDVLQLMMDATEKGSKNKRLTDEEIVANAWVFVLGGFETTASALTFTTYLLTKHQDIQQKLFNELSSAFPIDEIPSYEKVNNLTYLDQIICESLRLYPPVVAFVIREYDQTLQIGPYIVPPKLNIQIPVWEIHHDEELWPQPFKFDPERFSPANKKTHASMSWIPFGGGPRNCIGMRFALLETKLALARIFRTFKFLPSERTEDNLILTVPTVVITPINGVYVKCVRRTE